MGTHRTPLIAGNWKMNGSRAQVDGLAGELARRMRETEGPTFDMAVCPPFPLLAPVAEAIGGSGMLLGAQDCHANEKGAHTGDTSAALLADMGCRYVIVGHSERRADHGETDADVQAKAGAAQAADLVPIICVGETEAERDAGKAIDVVAGQIAGSVPAGSTAATVVIAYEPVWAIGTGRTPTLEDVAEVHAAIRAALDGLLDGGAGDLRILYGGSMKPENASGLLALDDVDGGLIGGASLKADDFWAIAQAVGS